MRCTSHIRSFLLALPIAACGSDAATSTPDAAAPDGALGFRVVSQTTLAGPLDALALTFSAPLDPTSLVDEAVVLRVVGGVNLYWVEHRVVPATVAYDDATQTLTITPRQALPTGSRAQIELQGVRSTAADELATEVTIPVKYNGYTGGESYDAGGDILFRATAERDPDDPEGSATNIYFNGPGLDGEWATADDAIASQYRTVRFAADEIRSSGAVGSGPNGLWGDADDVLNSWTRVRLDAQGHMLEELGYGSGSLGPDGEPFTADDVVVQRTVTARDAEGRSLSDITYDAPGPDGTWGTTDDTPAYAWDVVAYDDLGRVTRRTSFDDAGPDGIALTADDGLWGTFTYQYGPTGAVIATTRFGGPGPDGDWYTSDDVVVTLIRNVFGPDDERVRTLVYVAPGVDGDWGTGDDVLGDYTAYAPFALDLATGYSRYNDPGVDGDWFTVDDELQDRIGTGFAADGARTRNYTISGVGPDGLPFTADDVLGSLSFFDPTR